MTLDLRALSALVWATRENANTTEELQAAQTALAEHIDAESVLESIVALHDQLTRCEWAGRTWAPGMVETVPTCPGCGMPRKAGHTSTCTLARVLGRSDGR